VDVTIDKSSTIAPDIPRAQRGAVRRKRLRETLDVLRERYASNRKGTELKTGIPRAAEKATGISTDKASAWHQGRSVPGGLDLARLGDATGHSVDWMLGFDVPKYRTERELPALSKRAIRTLVARDLADCDSRFTAELIDRHLPDSEEFFETMVGIYAADLADEVRNGSQRMRTSIRAQLRKTLAALPEGWVRGGHDSVSAVVRSPQAAQTRKRSRPPAIRHYPSSPPTREMQALRNRCAELELQLGSALHRLEASESQPKPDNRRKR
jgi:hypothetical protein